MQGSNFPKIASTYIEVMFRKVYGNRRFYPRSMDAKVLCELLGSRTLTEQQLRICKENGWEVAIVTQEYHLQ